jgi:hypothetical protein
VEFLLLVNGSEEPGGVSLDRTTLEIEDGDNTR